MNHIKQISILTLAVTLMATVPAYAASSSEHDATVTNEVRALLDQNPTFNVEPRAVTVETIDGVTYLYGIVSTSFDRRLAESIAHKAADVGQVINSISVNK